jgi:hypothetical protein
VNIIGRQGGILFFIPHQTELQQPPWSRLPFSDKLQRHFDFYFAGASP